MIFLVCLYEGVVHRRINDIAKAFSEAFGICLCHGMHREEHEKEVDVERGIVKNHFLIVIISPQRAIHPCVQYLSCYYSSLLCREHKRT